MRSFSILDSTLREGEQYEGAFFTLEQRVKIACLLDALGTTFIEIPSPISSSSARQTAHELSKSGLHAHIVAHVRCVGADVIAIRVRMVRLVLLEREWDQQILVWPMLQGEPGFVCLLRSIFTSLAHYHLASMLKT